MTLDQIVELNTDLRHKTPLEIVRWAIAQAGGRAIVSTNFRPYEAVLLHLCTQVQPGIPVLWVDHGYNRAATCANWLPPFGLPPCAKSKTPGARIWAWSRKMQISAPSRSARYFTSLTRPWKLTCSNIICPTSGIISIRPRPTKSANAACTPRGERVRSLVQPRKVEPCVTRDMVTKVTRLQRCMITSSRGGLPPHVTMQRCNYVTLKR